MRKFYLALSFLILLSGTAFATNGDNLMGVGPISRAMGGVGIAAPQDPMSAVFANPAGMCFGPYTPGSEFNFAGTVFSPSVKAKVRSNAAGVNSSGKSESAPFIIPAIGISTPINPKMRFGIAAYGVSGMGVDYRNQLDLFPAFPGYEGAIYTQYQVMKFAPNLAYLITDNISVGASVHIDYAALDLGQGTAHDYTTGLQLGTIYKTGPVSLGLSYVTAQKVTHERVYNFNKDLNSDGDSADAGEDSINDSLDIAMPQTLGAGVAYQTETALIELNTKWVNWANAAGYKDFDWENQMVYALGAQLKATDALTLRAGYNFGKNPVKEHNGFDASTLKSVQGKNTTNFGYEYLRIIGFPAVVEQHVSLGAGYKISKALTANIGYTHAFSKEITESGTNFMGPGSDVSLSSELSEDSLEFGLSWQF